MEGNNDLVILLEAHGLQQMIIRMQAVEAWEVREEIEWIQRMLVLSLMIGMQHDQPLQAEQQQIVIIDDKITLIFLKNKIYMFQFL